MPVSILFEDNELLLINKPFGLPVQGGAGISHSLDQELSASLGYKIHLVHRLDKDTSGLMIVAKNAQSAAKWTKLISSRGVKKEYQAICIGLPTVSKNSGSGTLTTSVIAHGREQEARTDFTLISSGKVGDIQLSHLSLKLGTGRMHQIRIQLASSGAPIAADDQHGNFKLNKNLRKLGIKKLCLAAVKLTLPLSDGEKVFEVPLPDHMKEALLLMQGDGGAG